MYYGDSKARYALSCLATLNSALCQELQQIDSIPGCQDLHPMILPHVLLLMRDSIVKYDLANKSAIWTQPYDPSYCVSRSDSTRLCGRQVMLHSPCTAIEQLALGVLECARNKKCYLSLLPQDVMKVACAVYKVTCPHA